MAMYRSLEQQCPDFHLYIFAFDDRSFELLTELNLKKATVISLAEFEDESLLNIKASRTAAEYCWTCTPATVSYCLHTYQLSSCIYIDADLLFFSDPAILIAEMAAEESVLITDHRYSPEYDQSKTNGRYCVQFVYFKNDLRGRKALDWWRAACIEWCFNRIEDGKFGDQKYLDDWSERFEGVHELQHLGGGVAPWNVQQYDFRKEGPNVTGTVISGGKRFELVFYHFHHFKYCEQKAWSLGPYTLTKSDIKTIYKPYVQALNEAKDVLLTLTGGEYFHEVTEIPRIRKSLRRMFHFHCFGHINNYYSTKYLTK
ncbi:glycosyl transferase [Pedobacter gandavensis]|uniref:glycosyl transferase n=1 Tax=Pedobacter gandavensis TaxID=2679963 RepID=UPI002931F4F0|nr:glycosyl transferase [Pedobacter gandavensis]